MNYILSLKHSPRDGAAVWFLPYKRGYTIILTQAGTYTDSEVKRNRQYFDNGITTKAVPVLFATIRSRAIVPWGSLTESTPVANIPKVHLGGAV